MRLHSVRLALRDSDCRVAGERITPHLLRHTAATLLIERGVDTHFVQKLLGRPSISTIENIHARVRRGAQSWLQRKRMCGPA
ncbi:tyrosine-type recombinase/integrase [Bradyrhizobium brasilense]|uniref:tyrosine-type recombinase/integrase n=1 Tax=Bradyrhizobium brasilense TaxID=1419277 RepID=UPI001F36B948|nr:tyrosine-type recombinase/integrase [Bradyrhizobium brasilense]